MLIVISYLFICYSSIIETVPITLPFKLTISLMLIDRSIELFLYVNKKGGHGGRVVTLSPPTSEIGVQFSAPPQVGKLVVAYRWSVVYSTEP